MPVDHERLAIGGVGFSPERSEKGRRHAHALVDDGAEVFRPVQLGSSLDGAARGKGRADIGGEAGVDGRVS